MRKPIYYYIILAFIFAPIILSHNVEVKVLPLAGQAGVDWAKASFPIKAENRPVYTSPFGWRQHPFGGRRFHYGLDIAAPQGTPVLSWLDGEVIRLVNDSACGVGPVIQSGRYTHVYCHFRGNVIREATGATAYTDKSSGIVIRVGDRVASGQPIGVIGMTGGITGPHLHWGIRVDGVWADPAIAVKKMAEAQNG